MKVIQQTSPKHPSVEDAQDGLHGLSHINGFVVGFVDEKENRVVAFFSDAHPDLAIGPGQKRLELVFKAENAADAQARQAQTADAMSAIGSAISNGTDMRNR